MCIYARTVSCTTIYLYIYIYMHIHVCGFVQVDTDIEKSEGGEDDEEGDERQEKVARWRLCGW